MLDLLRRYRPFVAVAGVSFAIAAVVTIGPLVVRYAQWLAEPATTLKQMCLYGSCTTYGPPIPKAPFGVGYAVSYSNVDWMQFLVLWAVAYAFLTGLILSARALSGPGAASSGEGPLSPAPHLPSFSIRWGRVLGGLAMIAIAAGIVAGTSGPTSSTVVLPWGLALVGLFTLVGGFNRSLPR